MEHAKEVVSLAKSPWWVKVDCPDWVIRDGKVTIRVTVHPLYLWGLGFLIRLTRPFCRAA